MFIDCLAYRIYFFCFSSRLQGETGLEGSADSVNLLLLDVFVSEFVDNRSEFLVLLWDDVEVVVKGGNLFIFGLILFLEAEGVVVEER